MKQQLINDGTFADSVLSITSKIYDRSEEIRKSFFEFAGVEKCEKCGELVRKADYDEEQHMCKLCVEENKMKLL